MLETIFVSSTVLLCAIHVLRYFREKVLTGKAFWGEAGDKNYLCGADKDDIMTNIKLLRDSPSQDAFEEREAKRSAERALATAHLGSYIITRILSLIKLLNKEAGN